MNNTDSLKGKCLNIVCPKNMPITISRKTIGNFNLFKNTGINAENNIMMEITRRSDDTFIPQLFFASIDSINYRSLNLLLSIVN